MRRRILASALALCMLAVVAACSLTGTNEPPSAGVLAELSLGQRKLYPDFNPAQRDYSTRCDPDKTLLAIDARPEEEGAEVVLDPIAVNGVVGAVADDLITITVRAEGRRDESYYLRCLPWDFPDLSSSVAEPGPGPGYYLTATGWNDPDKRYFVVILDERGAVVWYKRSEALTLDVKVLPNGNLSWVTSVVAGRSEITERELDSTILKTWRHGDTFTDGHDTLLLPNGNLILSGVLTRQNIDVNVLAPHFQGRMNVMESWLRELTPEGEVVWEWKSHDHIAITETTVTAANAHDTGTATTVDLTHWNSVDIDDDNNLIISLRNTDGVYKIRRDPGAPDDGEVIWKLGGTPPTTPGAVHLRVIGDEWGGPVRQHDARFISDGFVSMFDNRTLAAEGGARGIIYEIDEVAGTATLTREWRQEDGRFACCFGSVRATDHDSVVIVWSTTSPLLTEFANDGTKLLEVWEERAKGTGTRGIYRVAWVPADTFDRDALRAAAGGTAQLTAGEPPGENPFGVFAPQTTLAPGTTIAPGTTLADE